MLLGLLLLVSLHLLLIIFLCLLLLVSLFSHLIILHNLLLSFCFWPLHLIHLLVALSMRIPLICTACYFRVVRLGYEFYLLHALLIVLIIYTIPHLLAQLLFIVPIFIVILAHTTRIHALHRETLYRLASYYWALNLFFIDWFTRVPLAAPSMSIVSKLRI